MIPPVARVIISSAVAMTISAPVAMTISAAGFAHPPDDLQPGVLTGARDQHLFAISAWGHIDGRVGTGNRGDGGLDGVEISRRNGSSRINRIGCEKTPIF